MEERRESKEVCCGSTCSQCRFEMKIRILEKSQKTNKFHCDKNIQPPNIIIIVSSVILISFRREELVSSLSATTFTTPIPHQSICISRRLLHKGRKDE